MSAAMVFLQYVRAFSQYAANTLLDCNKKAAWTPSHTAALVPNIDTMVKKKKWGE